jgi:hypothetical protein
MELNPSRADGLHFRELLRLIHWRALPRTYVEIGVSRGAGLELAAPGTRVLGVDPDPQLTGGLPPNITVFRQTSDEFFGRGDLHDLLAGQPVDLAFIDGMHLFEFALRDFMQLERRAHPGATILVHDCYPMDAATATRQRATRMWSGDVWKLILCLRRYRPSLRVTTLGAAPTGLGVIQGLDPDSRQLDEHYDELVAQYRDLEYTWLERDGGKPALLGYRPVTAKVLSELWPEPYRARTPYLQARQLVEVAPTRLRWLRERSSFVRTFRQLPPLPRRVARRARREVSSWWQPTRR